MGTTRSKKRLHSSTKGTVSLTRRGALLLETAQQPESMNGERQLTIGLSEKDYRLLEVLHEDVAAYIRKLVVSHCDGRRKSIAYNNKSKEANHDND
jgi:hypothetical protein